MSTLMLVRHGQAGSLEGVYDLLSELGREQARQVADHLGERGVRLAAVYSGTLERQRATAWEVHERLRGTRAAAPEPIALPEWNEYDGEGLTRAWRAEMGRRDPALAATAPRPDGERAKRFQRVFEVLMGEWAGGGRVVDGVEPWSEFHARVVAGLRAVTSAHPKGATVAVFSSGGAIGVAVQHVLGAPERTALELNWAIRNCSISELLYNRDKISLGTFNSVAHLEPELLTYR